MSKTPYEGVTVFPAEETPWSGGTGHRIAEIRRKIFSVDDEARGIRLRGAHEICAKRMSPRHRHTFEQIRYQRAGEQRYGAHRWTPGTLGYFPESVPYGPHVSGEGGFEEIDLQFPSPTGRLFGSNEELVRAMAVVRERGGVFADGLCRWPEGRVQDATEACWEALLGGAVDYAPPRLAEPVVVDTNAIPWRATAQPGVAVKEVGCFSSEGPRVSLLKIAAGARSPAGAPPTTQARFVVEGEVSFGGTALPAVSFIYHPPAAPHEGLVGRAEISLLLIVELRAPGAESLLAAPW